MSETPQPQPVEPKVEKPPSQEDAIRQELGQIILEILQCANELAFELADVDDERIINSDLYKSAKKLVRKLKKLKKITEKMQRR